MTRAVATHDAPLIDFFCLHSYSMLEIYWKKKKMMTCEKPCGDRYTAGLFSRSLQSPYTIVGWLRRTKKKEFHHQQMSCLLYCLWLLKNTRSTGGDSQCDNRMQPAGKYDRESVKKGIAVYKSNNSFLRNLNWSVAIAFLHATSANAEAKDSLKRNRKRTVRDCVISMRGYIQQQPVYKQMTADKKKSK